ncbi:OPT oligopeptide transporter protein-domain-containing protein [Lactarius pseudohatsudake]|nr:OPT oligopeptide transporter protein-domain-containing protein [Lactarius pseudohatsudake]
MANMYFVLFGYNSVLQAQVLLRDLKIAQYTKLPPRAAFAAQIFGTLFGSILNYIMMNSIIDNQREILLSVEGTNIWSGQQPQQYNSQSIAWGGLSHELFAHGKRYQWVRLGHTSLASLFPSRSGLSTGFTQSCVPITCTHPSSRESGIAPDPLFSRSQLSDRIYMSWLCVGINSLYTSYYAIALFSQWYLRTRCPRWFTKYNYILGAALDGGTQVMVFVLSFAVQGAAGTSHLFPRWWGANQGGNYDRCAVAS